MNIRPIGSEKPLKKTGRMEGEQLNVGAPLNVLIGLKDVFSIQSFLRPLARILLETVVQQGVSNHD